MKEKHVIIATIKKLVACESLLDALCVCVFPNRTNGRCWLASESGCTATVTNKCERGILMHLNKNEISLK